MAFFGSIYHFDGILRNTLIVNASKKVRCDTYGDITLKSNTYAKDRTYA